MEGLPSSFLDSLSQQRADVALKAIDAAIQFQGMRGYQQALKDGQPAEKAMTKYGPMIFRNRPGAFGSSVKALTPPSMTPYQQATIDERKAETARKALSPPKTQSTPGPIHAGSGVYSREVDPYTGQPIVLVPPTPRAIPLPPLVKAQKDILTDQIKKANDAYSKADETGKDKIGGIITGLNQQLKDLLQQSQPVPGPSLSPPTPEQGALNKSTFEEGARRAQHAEDIRRASSGKKITMEQAKEFLSQAGGDKAKARELARKAGFTF
jgi:hypothetical protein